MVTEDGVCALADGPEGKRAYVGYGSSGVPHIGHTLAANKLIDLQAIGFGVVVLLVDVHTYPNGKGMFEEIREMVGWMGAQFIAYGPDENQAELILNSEYQLDKSYVLDLRAVGLETTLPRAEHVMAEIKSGDGVTVAQTVYPIMQALGIVCLDVDLAIGGMEQCRVHMLARDTLPSIGEESSTCMYTPFTADPRTGISKMPSSESATISIEDSTRDIGDEVNGAFCPPTADPEPTGGGGEYENPVLQIFEYHVFPHSERAIVERPEQYGGNPDYDGYETPKTDLESNELRPADAEGTLADYPDGLIKPGRAKVAE